MLVFYDARDEVVNSSVIRVEIVFNGVMNPRLKTVIKIMVTSMYCCLCSSFL